MSIASRLRQPAPFRAGERAVRHSHDLTRWILAVCLAVAAPGCIVVSLQPYYRDTALTFEPRLIGLWHDADDNVTVTIGRGEWNAYRIEYAHPIEKGVLTGRLFTVGRATYLDLMPASGQDFGSFLMPIHVVLRVTIQPDAVVVAPLQYDWFDSGLRRGTLPGTLGAARAERGQVVLTANQRVLEGWLASRPADDPAFGPETTFTRDAQGR